MSAACVHVCIHVCSWWYLLRVALAVFADGRRGGVVVEDRTGKVVDHQHLALQRVLDEERHTVQPLALLEHIHTYAHGTQTHGTQAGRAELHAGAKENMCTCGHARTENTQGNAYTIGRVIKWHVCARKVMLHCFFFLLSHTCTLTFIHKRCCCRCYGLIFLNFTT